MSQLRVILFGYPHLFLDDRPVVLERRKTQALAAYLAVESGVGYHNGFGDNTIQSGCGRDTLAAIFWPEASQRKAGAYLRQSLWDFSGALGENWLLREGPSIQLNPSKDTWVDVNQFEMALERWKSSRQDAVESAQFLIQIVPLYQGDFMAGFSLRGCPAFDEWQSAQADLLHLHMTQVLMNLASYYQRQDDLEAALEFALRWSAMDRLDETAHRILMSLYAQTGKRNAALRQYQQCCDALREELSVEPEPETVALFESIQKKRFAAAKLDSTVPINPPSGTVTFVFTDIEGSTRLWETYPEAMPQAFKRQEAIIQQSMSSHGGYVYKMIGDAFQIAFSTAGEALAAAVDAQQKLHSESWGNLGQIKVRMALHTGVTEERKNDYVGPELNRVARIMGAGYGGQILLSQPTAELVRGHLPEQVTLVDLGEKSLRDLVNPEHIYQVQAAGLPADFPPLKTLDTLGFWLPVVQTPFVGRKHELVQIESLLENPDCRLITLLGIGGSGKTRLALQAARQTVSYQHNACFVSLASKHTTIEMIYAIAEALKFGFQAPVGSPISSDQAKRQLFQYLAGKRLLLVLDNFEQLIGQTEIVGELLQTAPELKLLVTSRERLNLPGEWVLEVLGLSFPASLETDQASNYPAIRLFTSSVQRICNTRLSEEDYPAIIRICLLLEGIPLGIEMAASWVKHLSCSDIASEVEKSMDFLSISWRGMPERHRTLRAVFDYSWLLLGERERTGFIRLGVFQDGFNRQTAWEVAGVSLLLLASLTDKSFLRRTGSGRYEIHPVLRSYVLEKLAESVELDQEVHRRHAAYFCNMLMEQVEELKSSDQLKALKALRAEVHNLESAIRWFVHQNELDYLERILPALTIFGAINDQYNVIQEFRDLLSGLLEKLEFSNHHPGLQALVLSILLYYSIYPYYDIQNIPSNEQIQDLISVLPESRTKAYTILLICIGPRARTLEQALHMVEISLKILREFNDPWEIALVHLILGDVNCYMQGDLTQARNDYQESFRAFKSRENPWGISLCYTGLMNVAKRELNFEEAYEYGLKAKEIYLQLDNQARIANVNDALGHLAARLGRLDEAKHFFEANLNYFNRMGDATCQQDYQRALDQLASGTFQAK